MWNKCESSYFRLPNGVKQGVVLSPILFNLYIDRLLFKTWKSGFGCHVNHVYIGVLSFVDDLTISCPKSINGLNFMLDICNRFACVDFISFKSKKTVCIKFGHVQPDIISRLINNMVVHFTDHFYGNIICCFSQVLYTI